LYKTFNILIPACNNGGLSSVKWCK